jgi:hypothetical protein
MRRLDGCGGGKIAPEIAFSPCVLLVEPRAGTQIDTADFLLHDGMLLGFSGRPLAASWRERHMLQAAFLLIRSRESLDRLALTAVVRSHRHTLVIDPSDRGQTACIDLAEWLRLRLPMSHTLYEFARVRGWQAQIDALLKKSDSTGKVSSDSSFGS